jgi:hypothetical protein
MTGITGASSHIILSFELWAQGENNQAFLHPLFIISLIYISLLYHQWLDPKINISDPEVLFDHIA